MNRLPALIFDFGNVVAFFDYARAGERLGRPLGIAGEEMLRRARDAGLAPLLRDYESGIIDTARFARSFGTLVGIEVPPDEFAAAWVDIFTLNEPIADLVAALKRKGYTLVLGSNTNVLQADHFRREFAEALEPFDAIVLSYEVGHVKPSPEFYFACARAAGAEPSDCVFIDDLPENIDGARAAGLTGLVFRDVVSLKADLAGLGILAIEEV